MLLRNAGPHGNKDASLETMKSIHYTGAGTRRMHSAGTLHTLQRGALPLKPMEEASSHSKNGARPMGGGRGPGQQEKGGGTDTTPLVINK